jgi:hypothetical protein
MGISKFVSQGNSMAEAHATAGTTATGSTVHGSVNNAATNAPQIVIDNPA